MILCFFACMTCANKGKRKEEKRELKRISTSPLPRLSLLYRRLPRSLVWDTQPAEKSLVFFALFKRKTSENSSPVALVRAPRPLRASVAPPPPPPKKPRKMASFLLTQFEVDFNFWTKITVLFIWEESSGPFCLLCPERSRRKVLMFFSRGVQYWNRSIQTESTVRNFWPNLAIANGTDARIYELCFTFFKVEYKRSYIFKALPVKQ